MNSISQRIAEELSVNEQQVSAAVALLERYDSVETDSPSKIGPGVDSFFRRQNPGQGFSCPGFHFFMPGCLKVPLRPDIEDIRIVERDDGIGIGFGRDVIGH